MAEGFDVERAESYFYRSWLAKRQEDFHIKVTLAGMNETKELSSQSLAKAKSFSLHAGGSAKAYQRDKIKRSKKNPVEFIIDKTLRSDIIHAFLLR